MNRKSFEWLFRVAALIGGCWGVYASIHAYQRGKETTASMALLLIAALFAFAIAFTPEVKKTRFYVFLCGGYLSVSANEVVGHHSTADAVAHAAMGMLWLFVGYLVGKSGKQGQESE